MLALPVLAFLIALAVPLMVNVGGLRLSPYRIVLLLTMPMLLARWLGGHAGRARTADITLFLLCFWAFLSFVVVHGQSVGIEAGGILFVETMGAYLLGRCLVRSADEFRNVVKVLFWIVLFFLPFAAIEAITGWNVILDVSQPLGAYPDLSKEPRWGLERVQASFEHPILFGVFCGAVIGPTHVVLGYDQPFFRRWGRTAIVFVTAALSLSAGPLTGMIAQLELIVWDSVLKRLRSRWFLLAALLAASLVALEIVASRPAPVIFINYFSFNEFSAYMRVHIWNFGTTSILSHPMFGIGFNEWERPAWMSSSIDMFWIVHGVRHGIPAMILVFMTFLSIYLPLAFRRGLDDFQHHCRLGLLFTLTSFFLMGWTVHFWNATFALFMFILGSSVWILDAKASHDNERFGETLAPDDRRMAGDVDLGYSRDLVATTAGFSSIRDGLRSPSVDDSVQQDHPSSQDGRRAPTSRTDGDPSPFSRTGFSRS